MDTNIDSYIEVNRLAYNKLSVEYKNRSEYRSKYETPPNFLVENVIKYVPENKILTVLEIGPGSGEIINCFDLLGHKTIAVDFSEEVIKIAQLKSPNTEFIINNILDVNFKNSNFDIIYISAVIHLFPLVDAKKLLKKLHLWLNLNGIMFINTTTHIISQEGFAIKEDYKNKVIRFRRKWTENDFKNFILEEFSIVHKLYTNETDRDKKWVGFICKKSFCATAIY